MKTSIQLSAIEAGSVPPRVRPSAYPPPFAAMMAGRVKRPLGEFFGLRTMGINLTALPPGAVSALRHAHTRQDEFVYVLTGELTLELGETRQVLQAGMCCGFPAGTGCAHRLVNEGSVEATYLEIGDRSAGDQVSYPDDDLEAREVDGNWVFCHKNGEPYSP